MVPAAGEPEQRDEGTHHEPGNTRQRRGRAPVCQVGDLIYGVFHIYNSSTYVAAVHSITTIIDKQLVLIYLLWTY